MHPKKTGKKRPHFPQRPSLTPWPGIWSPCGGRRPGSYFRAGNTKPIHIKQATHSALKKKGKKKNATIAFKDSTPLISCPAPLWLPAANVKGTSRGNGQSFQNKDLILWSSVAAYWPSTTSEPLGTGWTRAGEHSQSAEGGRCW